RGEQKRRRRAGGKQQRSTGEQHQRAAAQAGDPGARFAAEKPDTGGDGGETGGHPDDGTPGGQQAGGRTRQPPRPRPFRRNVLKVIVIPETEGDCHGPGNALVRRKFWVFRASPTSMCAQSGALPAQNASASPKSAIAAPVAVARPGAWSKSIWICRAQERSSG